MNLLAGKLYDPAGAVTAFTTSTTGVALVAFDTTNLRLTFTVPPSGFVRVRMAAQVHGATTFPTVLLGILSGAGVVGRQQPMQSLGNTAVATAQVKIESDFIVSGLTAGEAKTWDAAFGVEVGVASTGIKYGGANDAVANNAFGGFAFEIWDPCALYTPTSGVPPTTPVIAYTSGIKTKTDFLPSATVGTSGALVIAGANTPISFASVTCTGLFFIGGTSNISQTGDSFARIGAAGASLTAIDLPDQTMNITGNITGNLSGSVGCVTGLTAANLDATISSRMASYTQPTGFLAATFPATVASTTNITAGTITTATNLTNAPTSGDFTAVMKTSIGTAVAASAVASVTGNVTGSVGSVVGLTASNLDATVSSRLASASYTAPDNTSITGIKTQTDKLVFTVANKLDVNVLVVNGVTVTGLGTAGNPWGPL